MEAEEEEEEVKDRKGEGRRKSGWKIGKLEKVVAREAGVKQVLTSGSADVSLH